MDEHRLTSVPLFASLSDKERRRIAQAADEVDLPEGEHLVREGRFAYEIFVVEQGTAKVTRGDQHIADLGPGDVIGEMATMTDGQRNATVVSTSPVTLIVMTAREFRQIAKDMPVVAERIRAIIEERMKALTG
jgi:CRP/FNR family transcriptional regulator, cyclic AMP receptor protein